jgi:hypothetical protein
MPDRNAHTEASRSHRDRSVHLGSDRSNSAARARRMARNGRLSARAPRHRALRAGRTPLARDCHRARILHRRTDQCSPCGAAWQRRACIDGARSADLARNRPCRESSHTPNTCESPATSLRVQGARRSSPQRDTIHTTADRPRWSSTSPKSPSSARRNRADSARHRSRNDR